MAEMIYIDAPALINAALTIAASVGNIELNKNPLVNLAIQTQSTAPTSPVFGQVYVDSAQKKLGIYNGTGWDYLGKGDVLKTDFFDASNKLLIDALPAHASTHKSGGADAIRLNELAAPNADLSLGGYAVSNLAAASADNQAPNWGQVKNLFAGFKWKENVRAVATTNVTMSGTQTIDGVSTSSGRFLLAGQTNPAQNGVYDGATWTRSADCDSWEEMVGAHIEVTEGTTYADTEWRCKTNSGGTLGTTTVTWAQIPTVSFAVEPTSGALTLSGGYLSVNVDNDTIRKVNNQLQIHPNARIKTYRYGLLAAAANETQTITNPTGTGDIQVSVRDSNGYLRMPSISVTTSSIKVTFGFAISANQFYLCINN